MFVYSLQTVNYANFASTTADYLSSCKLYAASSAKHFKNSKQIKLEREKNSGIADLKKTVNLFFLGEKSVIMDSTGVNPNSVVKLNVGGTIFMTTQGTLLSDQNSMLAKMFSTETNGGRFPGNVCNSLRGNVTSSNVT